MPFNFHNLDSDTRRGMMEEIGTATSDDNLYFSTRFTPEGHEAWPSLLTDAAREYDEHWLAFQLEERALMIGLEGKRTPSGGYTISHVPHTAALTMAEGQFNRYYILSLARQAIDNGNHQLTVYRAKDVSNPRSKSEALVGTIIDPSELIEQIRPRESSLHHELLKPNSGLSVHL